MLGHSNPFLRLFQLHRLSKSLLYLRICMISSEASANPCNLAPYYLIKCFKKNEKHENWACEFTYAETNDLVQKGFSTSLLLRLRRADLSEHKGRSLSRAAPQPCLIKPPQKHDKPYLGPSRPSPSFPLPLSRSLLRVIIPVTNGPNIRLQSSRYIIYLPHRRRRHPIRMSHARLLPTRRPSHPHNSPIPSTLNHAILLLLANGR